MKLTQELVEKMKTNNTNWYYLDEEMKFAFRRVPMENLSKMSHDGWFFKCCEYESFTNQYIYRLDKDFKLPTVTKKKLVGYDALEYAGGYFLVETPYSDPMYITDALNKVGCVGVSYKEDTQNAIVSTFPAMYHTLEDRIIYGTVDGAGDYVLPATPDKVWFLVEDES